MEKRINIATPLLALLSFLYGLGVRLRLAAVKRRRKRSLPGFVVSIGNLTTGGTGKTPAACMLAEWASGEGHKAVVLSRGYRGSYKTKVFVVSDGNEIYAGPGKAGDEPYLLAERLSGVPVIISKNRYLAGTTAHDRYGSNFFILDDGFQHLALKRDLDILLIDALSPFGNGHLLPWGPLREPEEQLLRADAVIFTGSGMCSEKDNMEDDLRKKLQDKPLFRSDHIPEKVVFPFKSISHDPNFLKGKRVIAFAGIARPESFKHTLISLGADLLFLRSFGDHHIFRSDEIKDLKTLKEREGADFLVTTEKDWVRFKDIEQDYPDLAYLTIKFALLSDQERFFGMVKDRIVKKRALYNEDPR
ncbi:tetraacyldisaccharide 4'-kinase [Thermodesulfobacteriota bacterium]